MKNLYQLKIQVKNIKPSIFRTILVDENATFLQLHKNIQSIFGFMDYHLWEFETHPKYGPSLRITEKREPELDKPELYAEKTTLNKIFTEKNYKLSYLYDFGDNWQFDIELQKILLKNETTHNIEKIPHLLKVKGPMLMEDIGGTYFWKEIIDTYHEIVEGKEISQKKIDDPDDIIQRIIGDNAEKGDELGLFEVIISELFETYWEEFDIEENYISLKEEWS